MGSTLAEDRDTRIMIAPPVGALVASFFVMPIAMLGEHILDFAALRPNLMDPDSGTQ